MSESCSTYYEIDAPYSADAELHAEQMQTARVFAFYQQGEMVSLAYLQVDYVPAESANDGDSARETSDAGVPSYAWMDRAIRERRERRAFDRLQRQRAGQRLEAKSKREAPENEAPPQNAVSPRDPVAEVQQVIDAVIKEISPRSASNVSRPPLLVFPAKRSEATQDATNDNVAQVTSEEEVTSPRVPSCGGEPTCEGDTLPTLQLVDREFIAHIERSEANEARRNARIALVQGVRYLEQAAQLWPRDQKLHDNEAYLRRARHALKEIEKAGGKRFTERVMGAFRTLFDPPADFGSGDGEADDG